jgi:myo-inositol 2-dehydrogenase/D-chiro-inositol 1-dehydrogenase
MTRDHRIGIIGTGNIGTSHAESLTHEVSGAVVSVVYDPDLDRARSVAAHIGARTADDARGLIESEDVDAVLIASPDELHAEQALQCLAVGKPALVEKPLAPALADAHAVVAAEVALGQRLLTLGFMRRFDPGYQQLKQQLDSQAVGDPLIVRNLHRNTSAPYGLLTSRTMTNMAIHEMDINRWLTSDEYESVQVIAPHPGPNTPAGQLDPLLILFRTTRGVIVEIEAFVNANYGYEVSCSVVATEGLLDMGDGGFITRTRSRERRQDIPELWLGRFADAYRRELQAWIDSLNGSAHSGAASAWDGLAATVAAQAAVDAVESGTAATISLPARPSLYL